MNENHTHTNVETYLKDHARFFDENYNIPEQKSLECMVEYIDSDEFLDKIIEILGF